MVFQVVLTSHFQLNIRLHRSADSAYMTNLWEEHSHFPILWMDFWIEFETENIKNTLQWIQIVVAAQWTMVGLSIRFLNLKIFNELFGANAFSPLVITMIKYLFLVCCGCHNAGSNGADGSEI